MGFLFFISALIVLVLFVLVLTILIVSHKRIRQKQKELYESMIGNLEAEQMKIGRDLHDQTSPFLSGLKLYVQTNPNFDEEFNRLALQGIEAVRAASHNLSPPGLQENGLAFAISFLAQNVFVNRGFEIQTRFEIRHQISEVGNLHIYRIIAELMGNAVKYSRGTLVKVSVVESHHDIIVEVEDNGIGMDTSVGIYSEGLGWQSINNRLGILNGINNVTSSSTGTKVNIQIPLTSVL